MICPAFIGHAFPRKTRRIMAEMEQQVEIEDGHHRS
jgi:hypothetical protein